MKYAFFALAIAATVLLLGCTQNTPSANTTGTTTEPNTVVISNFAFNPSTLSVPAGTTVKWMNNDQTTHTVTGESFSSGNLAPGESFMNTFTTAGTYTYHCSIHPAMTGTITVV